MKKITTLFLSLLLILAMAVQVYAVTPSLNTPSISIPDISDSVNANIEEQYDLEHTVDSWMDEHPITIDPTEEPTEESTEAPEEGSDNAVTSFTIVFEWNRWLYQWWNNLIH